MSAHVRYVGRPGNTNIFINGYEADTGVLDLTSPATFRKAIVDVIAGKFQGRPTRLTIQNDGFRLTSAYLVPPGTADFDFAFLGTLAWVKNPQFMQAVAQYMVLSFIQMVVDLQRATIAPAVPPVPPVPAVPDPRTAILASCATAISTALSIIKEPLLKPLTLRPADTIMNDPERQALIDEVTGVLNTISSLAVAPITVTPNTMTITVDGQPVVIDMSAVTNIDDMLVYNANIAATLLLAARHQGTDMGKPELRNLKAVLKGYSLVRNGGVVGAAGAAAAPWAPGAMFVRPNFQ